MSEKKKYLYGIMTGALLAVSFPPSYFPLLAFIGFIPLLYVLIQPEETRHPFRLLYLTFFIFHGGTNWWISSWRAETDPYLMISGIAVWIAHPFFFFIPIAVFNSLRKKLGNSTALWLFPFIWTAAEWVHSLSELSYPWQSIGYSQIPNLTWLQFVDITGVWGASFLIALANVIILKLILHYKASDGGRFIKDKVSIPLFISLVIIFLLPYIYGVVRISEFGHNHLIRNNKSLNIGLIQPNINPWAKWQQSPIGQIRIHQRIQDSLKKAVKKLDLCLWSETTILYLGQNVNFGHDFKFLQQWVDTNGTSLLTGFADYRLYDSKAAATVSSKAWALDSTKYYDSFNSAIMLNSFDSPNQLQIYHKMKLTPFAERIPHLEIFGFLGSFLQWGVGISAWGIGTEQKNLIYISGKDSVRIAPIICIESIYPGFVSNFTDLGAGILTVITNDAWYDFTTGPEQHFQIAAMRAIENKRYLARCANTGVTGFISPTGESFLRLPQYESLGIAATIPILQGKTIYVKYGDWLPIGCFVLIILAYVTFFINRRGAGKREYPSTS